MGMEALNFCGPQISTFWAGLAAPTRSKGTGEMFWLWFPFLSLFWLKCCPDDRQHAKKNNSPAGYLELIFCPPKLRIGQIMTNKYPRSPRKNVLKAQNVCKKSKNVRKSA